MTKKDNKTNKKETGLEPMTYPDKNELKDTPEQEKQMMHSIIFKEKDKEGNFLLIDVDNLMPSFMFGEAHPMIIGIVGDKAFHIPLANVNWFEQHYGVKKDTELAMRMLQEKLKKVRPLQDASVA